MLSGPRVRFCRSHSVDWQTVPCKGRTSGSMLWNLIAHRRAGCLLRADSELERTRQSRWWYDDRWRCWSYWWYRLYRWSYEVQEFQRNGIFAIDQVNRVNPGPGGKWIYPASEPARNRTSGRYQG